MRKKNVNLRYYPIAVRLSDKSTVVIGGGKVAERKTRALRKAGAKITLVSPAATTYLRSLAERKKIKWVKRNVREGDITGADIVVAATDNKNINKNISAHARRRRIWINVVDKKDLSDFITPAVFRTGKGIITTYTDGEDPELSRDLKNFLKEYWNDFLSYRHRL